MLCVSAYVRLSMRREHTGITMEKRTSVVMFKDELT